MIAVKLVLPYIIIFLILLTYGIVKSPIDSLFLQYQSATRLPVAWILMMIASFVVMQILNYFSSRHSMLKILIGSTIASVLILLLFCVTIYHNPILSVYALLIWKEIYIVVLIEIFWSYLNLFHSANKAKWSYGFMLAFGSIGNSIGNIYIGSYVLKIGSVTIIYLSMPLFIIIAGLSTYWYQTQNNDKIISKENFSLSQFKQAVNLLKQSKYLTLLFWFVILSQIAATLVEYQLSSLLARNYTDLDQRTSIMGTIEAAINILSFVMQILAGSVFKIFGVGSTLLGIPIILLVALIIFSILPQVSIIITTRIMGKAFDYSLLRTARDLLYIPLSRPEKTQGKTMIDIFAYRTARGLCSMLLLALAAISVHQVVIYCALAVLGAWALLAHIIANRFNDLTKLPLRKSRAIPSVKQRTSF